MSDLRAAQALANAFPALEKMENDVLALGSRMAPAQYRQLLKRVASLRRHAMMLGLHLAAKHDRKRPTSH